MSKSNAKPFTVIEGGKAEQEHKKYLLFSQPWVFDLDEFDQLCELFQLSRSEVYDLVLMRIAHKAKTDHEAAALLAIFTGRGNASDILARGRRKSFKLVASGPRALPQSCAPADEDPA